jgi:cytoskeletal protein RodZ
MSLAARNHKANSWSSSSSSSSSAAAAESVRRVGRQPPLVKSPTSDRTTPKPTSSDDGYYLVKDVVRGWQSASSDTDKNVECKVTYASTDEYLSFQPAQPKPKTKTDTSIVDEAYWTGDVHEAESKMKLVKTEGAYLIRESTEHGQQTLMVKRGNNVCKYRIYTVQRENMDKFCLKAGGPFFDSKVLLIKFYMSNMLPHDTTKLKCPYTACI